MSASSLPDLVTLESCLQAAGDDLARAVPDGRLAYGVIHRGQTVAEQIADVPFRIASMSKSFTAALIGLLGLRGLDLHAPLISIVPELRGTAVAGLTCHQALTMSTGFSKDDPWADRMESLSRPDFIDILHRDLIPIAPPGSGFEYSNLNFALLGLVAETISGRALPELVCQEVNAPLGLTRTAFDHAQFPDLAPGFRIDHEGSAHRAELTGPGAFSAIGGLISTVRDIAVWISVHLESLDRSDGGRPTRSSDLLTVLARNQEPCRLIKIDASSVHTEAVHYGYGLQHRMDSRFGRVICHSGGYPGYGSHMRWFPELDLGVVVLANTSNYPAEKLVEKAVDDAWLAATGDSGEGPNSGAASKPDKAAYEGGPLARTTALAPVSHFPAVPELSQRVLDAARMVVDWDESFANEHFASNMDLDEPRAERRSRWAQWCENNGVDHRCPLTFGDLTMETRLLGTATVPIVNGSGEARVRPSTITVRLNHLGEVQSILVSD